MNLKVDYHHKQYPGSNLTHAMQAPFCKHSFAFVAGGSSTCSGHVGEELGLLAFNHQVLGRGLAFGLVVPNLLAHRRLSNPDLLSPTVSRLTWGRFPPSPYLDQTIFSNVQIHPSTDLSLMAIKSGLCAFSRIFAPWFMQGKLYLLKTIVATENIRNYGIFQKPDE